MNIRMKLEGNKNRKKKKAIQNAYPWQFSNHIAPNQFLLSTIKVKTYTNVHKTGRLAPRDAQS